MVLKLLPSWLHPNTGFFPGVIVSVFMEFNGPKEQYYLRTRKSTGTSCQIEIHFSIENTKFLMKYNLVCFQISCRLVIFLLSMIPKF